MRIIRHVLKNKTYGVIVAVLSILLIGLIPVETVFAASTEVSIPYRQMWKNDSGTTVDSSFEYRLTSRDGAPMPDEADGDYYSFRLKGNKCGNIRLHFPFTKPGYYNYLVRAYIPDRQRYYSYDEETYFVMIMVRNTSQGLGIGAVTIQDKDLAKYPELGFSMSYDKPGEDDPGEDDPGGNNPGGNGNAVIPQGDGPPTVVPDPSPPTTVLPDPSPPQTLPPIPDNWALLNLILMLLTIVIALVDGVLYFTKPTDKYGDEYESDDVKRHGLFRVLAILTAIASLILFILTEDITKPMVWVDEYTIWMLILFIVAVLLSMLSKKETDEDSDSMEAAT